MCTTGLVSVEFEYVYVHEESRSSPKMYMDSKTHTTHDVNDGRANEELELRGVHNHTKQYIEGISERLTALHAVFLLLLIQVQRIKSTSSRYAFT